MLSNPEQVNLISNHKYLDLIYVDNFHFRGFSKVGHLGWEPQNFLLKKKENKIERERKRERERERKRERVIMLRFMLQVCPLKQVSQSVSLTSSENKLSRKRKYPPATGTPPKSRRNHTGVFQNETNSRIYTLVCFVIETWLVLGCVCVWQKCTQCHNYVKYILTAATEYLCGHWLSDWLPWGWLLFIKYNLIKGIIKIYITFIGKITTEYSIICYFF